jgi:hypothetical protein
MRNRIRMAPVLVLFAASLTACGGGSSGGGPQPTPPQANFSLALSSSSVAVSQGAASSPVTISISPQNGFSSTVQVSLNGLPSGVTTNPASPFSISTSQNVSLLFGAASNCATGQFNVTANGTSGSLSNSQSLSLSVQAVTPPDLPLTAYVEDDSVATIDTPSGQAVRRQVVYDAANQRFYVANPAMNRVEVFNASSPSMEATIDVPGASSVDLSADGQTLWVGTTTEQILAVSTSSLQVIARYPVAGLAPTPEAAFIRPTEVLALSSGQQMVRLRQASTNESLLALWSPASGTFTNLTSLAPAVFQNGVGVLARSGDHSTVLAAANDTSGEVALFDGNGNLVAGPQVPLAGTISSATANSSGTQFAIAVTATGVSQVLLLNSQLATVGTYPTSGASGLVFSADGQSLCLIEPYSNASVLSIVSVANLQKTGQIADIAIQGVPTRVAEVGAVPFVYGLGNRGVAYLDISQPAALPSVAPVFANAPVSQPSEGPAVGGTSLSLRGTNLSPDPQVRFGANNPVSATSTSSSQMQITSPASVASGPVNLTAYFTNGWLALAPNAFSYGPRILRALPNAGSPAGGDTITLYGYGFGGSADNVSVTIGGQSATIVSVDAAPTPATALDLDSTFPFPLERVVLQAPPGSAGYADLAVTSSAGSTVNSKSFQYVTSSQTYANAALHKFLVYDPSRQRVYLSATDHVDVFDLTQQAFVSPIEPPPNGPPPDAALRGVAFTPDHSQLLVADFGAQNVYLIDPDGAAYNGTAVNVGGVAGFAASGPSRVAATNAQTVFVGLSGEGSSPGACSNCLGQMNMVASPPTFEPAPEPEVTSLTGAPLLQADTAGDTAYLAYDSAPGGPFATWTAATPNAFSVSVAQNTATDLTTAGDGTWFSLLASDGMEIRDANLNLTSVPSAAEIESIPNLVSVPGVAMHPSGALLYEPFLDGPPPAAPPATGIHGGIDIRDAHNGQLRLRIYLPEPFAMLSTDIDGLHGQFLTTDQNGQQLFALTTSGLTIVQLAAVPLGIGTLNPATGAASGGVTVTLRGSGFQSGITATLGGQPASATLVDMNTLTLTTPKTPSGPQQVVLTNPDGHSVSLDAAYVAQ